jgi:hypothetical protein
MSNDPIRLRSGGMAWYEGELSPPDPLAQQILYRMQLTRRALNFSLRRLDL